MMNKETVSKQTFLIIRCSRGFPFIEIEYNKNKVISDVTDMTYWARTTKKKGN